MLVWPYLYCNNDSNIFHKKEGVVLTWKILKCLSSRSIAISIYLCYMKKNDAHSSFQTIYDISLQRMFLEVTFWRARFQSLTHREKSIAVFQSNRRFICVEICAEIFEGPALKSKNGKLLLFRKFKKCILFKIICLCVSTFIEQLFRHFSCKK